MTGKVCWPWKVHCTNTCIQQVRCVDHAKVNVQIYAHDKECVLLVQVTVRTPAYDRWGVLTLPRSPSEYLHMTGKVCWPCQGHRANTCTREVRCVDDVKDIVWIHAHNKECVLLMQVTVPIPQHDKGCWLCHGHPTDVSIRQVRGVDYAMVTAWMQYSPDKSTCLGGGREGW